MMTPSEARARLVIIRQRLRTPKVMYGNEIGPLGDLYRAIDGLVEFLEEALVP